MTRNGIPRQEALILVQGYVLARVKMVRSIGIRNIITGFLMMCVPVFGWGLGILFFSRLLGGLMLATGAWGVWRFVNGWIQAIAPRIESGDVADK
jgi:hypothetical protein